MTRGDGLARVEREIRQAKAETLGRVGERLDAVLAELAAQDRALDRWLAARGAPDDPQPARALEARNRLRDQAQRLVQQLIIQREALGLVRHALVGERYPVPPRRTLECHGPADG
jgi:hypothetical protein